MTSERKQIDGKSWKHFAMRIYNDDTFVVELKRNPALYSWSGGDMDLSHLTDHEIIELLIVFSSGGTIEMDNDND